MHKTALILLAILGLSLFGWAQQPTGFTGSREVVLSQNTLVGSQILPAGTYKVTHVMEGAEHIMLFTQNNKEFRVKCNLEPIEEKAQFTKYRYDMVNGQQVLDSIEFHGDNYRHVFAK
jgi:hypothetical protein